MSERRSQAEEAGTASLASQSALTQKAQASLAGGTAAVLAGQAAFVLSGYLLHFYLSRAMDLTAYGIYGVLMNMLTWTESALQNGVPWAIRKFLPEDPQASAVILRAGLWWQLAVGAVLYVGTILVAPWFTGAMRDPGLTFYVRLALSDIIWMALYTYYRGALNGLRLFGAQGISMAAYALGKLGISVLLVAWGYSLRGALIGNVLGSVAGWLAAVALLQRRPHVTTNAVTAAEHASRKYNGRTILGFALPAVLFTLAGTFLTTVGLLGVKALVADGEQVGYYAAANYLATVPNLLLVAFSLTLFPHLAGSIAARNQALTSTYIRAAVRYLALALIPGTFLVLGLAPRLIAIVYPPRYAAAAPLLSLLIISTGLYSLYMVFANAILAEGRVLLALSIPSALVPVSLLATWGLTTRLGPSGAALAAVVSTALAVALAAMYVLRRFAVHLDWFSLLRIAAAGVTLYGLTRIYAPGRPVWLIPYLALLGVAYAGLLIGLRELDGKQIRRSIAHWLAR